MGKSKKSKKEKSKKARGIAVKIAGKKLHIRLSLNALCEIAEKYGDMSEALGHVAKGNMLVIKTLLEVSVIEEIKIEELMDEMDIDDIMQFVDAIIESVGKLMETKK